MNLHGRRRLLLALICLTVATALFLAAYEAVPDPEPHLSRYAFMLLFGATYACVYGGVASAVAAIAILFFPRSR